MLKNGAGHIGYSIKKEYRGKGYATKGLELTLEIARTIVPEDEIYLRLLKSNKASLRVMEKNGARSIGYWIALLGNFVVCIGLLLNGFEIVSHTGFRIIVLIGVIIDFVALFFIWKKSEL